MNQQNKDHTVRNWSTLPELSKVLYKETYFLPEENYDEWLYRVATAYQNDTEHGLRMMSYIQNLWFHPSTPPSSNAGTNRGLPISCFTKTVLDNKPSIFKNYNEAFNLGAYGGGIGSDWSSVRSVNEPVGIHGGKSGGVIPFLGISDRSTLGISQGGLRRASEAVYLHISHPEIEEFIDLRKETGDHNRRCPNLHHGVVIPDSFMNAVIHNSDWDLISPKTDKIIKTIPARKLWTQLLEARVTNGEPYIMFEDTVNELAPEEYKNEDIHISTSNLCTEITLRTDDKHSGVCCLGSINLEYWDEYQHCFDQFIADCSDYLDNILQDFIDRTENLEGFERTRAGAIDERSLGLGVMGFHSLLQSKLIPWESPMAKGFNLKIFKQIKDSTDRHNKSVLHKYCPMSRRHSTARRNIHVTAIAPTMSISSLCGVTSSGIEPWVTNAFTKKMKQGSFAIKNKYLENYIKGYFFDVMRNWDNPPSIQEGVVWESQQWNSIKKNNGSVQHLDWMSQEIKDVFKTAFELDQRYLLEFAGDRSPLIDQGQSLNIFIPAGSSVQYISDLHILAWKKKIKSLYYIRSSAGVSASTESGDRKQIQIQPEECLSCQ